MPVSLQFRVCASLLALLPAHVLAEYRLGEYGAVAFGLNSQIRASNNILLSSSEREDVIFDIAPSIKYKTTEGYGSIDAEFGFSFRRYIDNGNFDSNDIRSRIQIQFPDEQRGENYTLNLQAGWNEYTQAESALQAVTTQQILNTDLTATYAISNYVALRSSPGYRLNDYRTPGFSDITTYTLPIALYYQFDEAFSAGAGYRFRDTETSDISTTTSRDHSVYLGFENQRSELLRYEVLAGVQIRSTEGSTTQADETGAYIKANATWAMTERNHLTLKAGSDFGSTAASQTTETQFLAFGLTHEFDKRWKASSGILYEEISYSQNGNEREDEALSFNLKTDFEMIPRKLRLNGYLRFTDQTSSLTSANYQLIEAGIGCSFLY